MKDNFYLYIEGQGYTLDQIDTLRDIEREMVVAIYKLGFTFEQVGKNYGVTRERVRQLTCKAKKKLETTFPKKPKTKLEIIDDTISFLCSDKYSNEENAKWLINELIALENNEKE